MKLHWFVCLFCCCIRTTTKSGNEKGQHKICVAPGIIFGDGNKNMEEFYTFIKSNVWYDNL